ncbi:MAG: RtcB family protein [Bacteroides sp.]|nr:RtcB family protein [Bacteroides sp.]
MKTIEGHDVKIFTDNIENSALEQIKTLLSIDVFADKKIRIMPDVHAGAGCVIGFTGDLGDKVIPNIVGVDIGCGMRVLKLGKLTNIDFHAFHEFIRSNVPSGKIVREDKFGFKPLVGAEMDIYREAKQIVTQLYCYRQLKDAGRINRAIGTLGGGNHFIELDKDDEGNVYLVIHTGSRNLGLQVANIYQELAIRHMTAGADAFEDHIKEVIAKYKAAGRRSELQDVIKKMRREQEKAEPSLPADLCYVEGEGREQYLHDMRLCQRWAVLNRKLISLLLLKFFPDIQVEGGIAKHSGCKLEEFESVHNYISDDNIIRKGSISAAVSEKCIIPLNMRDGSLICIGKGNPDWNQSAPHGAGRVLSRTQAYEQITIADFEESMRGIYSESVNDFTRDESPMVYKPASEIIANIGDTVDITAIIRPIFNFKAS